MKQEDLHLILKQFEIAPVVSKFADEPEYKILAQAAHSIFNETVGTDLLRKTFYWEYYQFVKGSENGLAKGSFKDFEELVHEGKLAGDIARKYPVLRDFYIRKITHLNQQIELVYCRFVEDRKQIAAHFFGGTPSLLLTDVEWGVSDCHQGGQQVHVLVFEGRRIVYKPRSLTVDIAFQKYLEFANQSGSALPLLTLKILNREEYGWAEYIQNNLIDSPQELSRYYNRFGGLLAILYSLGAVDFHYENLIACGENPVLVDLESCFQPKIDKETFDATSVLNTAMLPTQLWQAGSPFEIDISAIGGGLQSKSELFTDQIIGFETDELRLTRVQAHAPRLKHLPTKQKIEIWKYTEEIIKGFTDSYCWLKSNAKFLTNSKESPLNSFQECSPRYLARNTLHYSKLIKNSFHPKLLASEPLWREHLSILAKSFPKGLAKLYNAISEFEICSLMQGDIPLFRVPAQSTDLICDNGSTSKNWPNIFEASPLKQVQDRLNIKMGVGDLKRQQWFIRSTLQFLAPSHAVHTFNLFDYIALFNSIYEIISFVNKKPIYIKVKSVGGKHLLGKLEGQDANEIYLIGKTLEMLARQSKNQMHIDLCIQSVGLIENSVFKEIESKFRKVQPAENADFQLRTDILKRETLQVDYDFLKAVDWMIDSEKHQEVGDYFKLDRNFVFDTPGGILTPVFCNGLVGLLYLALRLNNPNMQSIFR